MTKREQYLDALKTLGMVEVPTRSKKYLTLQSPTGGPLYYLGKSGAIRRGSTTTADSIPIDGARILAMAKKLP